MRRIAMGFFAACAALGLRAETLAYWDFSSDPLGVLDVSGHCNTLTNGGVRIVDGAAELDGSAHVLRTLAPLPFNRAKPYTIEFFARSDSSAKPQCLTELSHDVGGNVNSFFFFFDDGFMARGADGWNGETFKSSPCGDGQWHHYAGVIRPQGTNNVAEQVQFYVDGVRQDHYQQYRNPNIFLGTSYLLYIGSRGNATYPFKGAIDDLRITSGELVPSQFLKSRTTNAVPNVVCHYTFDAADPFADASGKGNVLTGSGVSFADGYAHFDGAAHVLNTAEPLALSAYDAVTIEYFVRLRSTNQVQMVYEYTTGAGGSNTGSFFMTCNERPGPGDLCGSFFSQGGVWHIDTTANISLGTHWHHVAMVCDRTASGDDQCRLYVDGYPQFQDKVFRGTITAPFADARLYFGSRNNAQFWLDGDIDDFRITAQALQPGQFLRNRTGARDDVVAYWDFDPHHGAFSDRSANAYGLVAEGVTVSDQQTAVLDGAQSRFHVPALQLWECGSLTVEFFLRTTNGTETAMLCELGPNFNEHSGSFAVTLNEGTPGILNGGFNLNATDVSVYAVRRSSGVNVADGRWHHVALVYDDETAYVEPVRLYLDGQPCARTAHDGRGSTRLLSGSLCLGSRGNAGIKFTGELDDVRLTARALTPAEFMKRHSGPKGSLFVLR